MEIYSAKDEGGQALSLKRQLREQPPGVSCEMTMERAVRLRLAGLLAV